MLENTALDETFERTHANPVGVFGRVLDPVTGVIRLNRLCNPGEHRIEKIVTDRGRIDQEEPFRIGVDPVLQREVHQHPAGQGAAQRPPGHACELPALVVENEQHDLFGKTQHRRRPLFPSW